MRPFSAFKYVEGNRARSVVIAFMMACITVCFIAGMYIDHPYETFALVYDKPSSYAWLHARGNSLEVYDEFHDLSEKLDDYTPGTATITLPAAVLNIQFTSILGFDNVVSMPIFISEEDFSEFNEATGAVEGVELKDCEIVLSRTLADNWGVKEGDVLKFEKDVWMKAAFYRPMTVKAIVDIPGTVLYGVDTERGGGNILVVKNKDADPEAASADLEKMEETIEKDFPHVEVETNKSYLQEVANEMSMMKLILVTITVLVGIVLAVTVSAAFSAAYDKRRYEFSIYKALGFTNGQIFGKVFKEVMLLNVIGLAAGAILNLTAIGIINYLLKPQGVFFFKFSMNGLAAVLVCDLIVVVPAILMNMKRVRKYDVTEY